MRQLTFYLPSPSIWIIIPKKITATSQMWSVCVCGCNRRGRNLMVADVYCQKKKKTVRRIDHSTFFLNNLNCSSFFKFVFYISSLGIDVITAYFQPNIYSTYCSDAIMIAKLIIVFASTFELYISSRIVSNLIKIAFWFL